MRDAKFPSRARLYAFTTVHVPHPEYGRRYRIGYADLEGGSRVFGHIPLSREVAIGDPVDVEMVVEDDERLGVRVRTRLLPVDEREARP